MTHATTDAVETELGRPPSATESLQWAAWLDRVERAIVRRFKRSGLDLATQVTAGDPEQQDVADIEVAAVVRKIQSLALGGGLTSITTSVDDGTITKRREQADSGDPLELRFDEWAVLLPTVASGASSTRPYFEPDGDPTARLDWS